MSDISTAAAAAPTTNPAAAFGGSENGAAPANGDNKPESGFKKLLRDAYNIGKDQGTGDNSRFAILDLFRVGALENEIPYVQPKKGAPKKGTIDDSPVGQLSAKYISGITKAEGNASKATQKNRFNQVVAWCAGPDSREQDATWQRAVAKHKELTAQALSDKTVKIYGLAEVMLRISALYTKKGGAVDRNTPPSDDEINKAIRRVSRNKEFAAHLKTFMTHLTEELEAQGGDGAESEYASMLAAGNALNTLLTMEYNTDAAEKKAAVLIDDLVATGVYIRTRNGGIKLAA